MAQDSILQENSNIEKLKRNLENCSPYSKPKQKKTLEADTNELNKYFDETGKRLTTTEPHSNDEPENLIGSFPVKNIGFQLQTVSYEYVEQCLRLLQNDCSTGYDNIPAMFIKPVVEFLVSPLTFVIDKSLTII